MLLLSATALYLQFLVCVWVKIICVEWWTGIRLRSKGIVGSANVLCWRWWYFCWYFSLCARELARARLYRPRISFASQTFYHTPLGFFYYIVFILISLHLYRRLFDFSCFLRWLLWSTRRKSNTTETVSSLSVDVCVYVLARIFHLHAFDSFKQFQTNNDALFCTQLHTGGWWFIFSASSRYYSVSLSVFFFPFCHSLIPTNAFFRFETNKYILLMPWNVSIARWKMLIEREKGKRKNRNKPLCSKVEPLATFFSSSLSFRLRKIKRKNSLAMKWMGWNDIIWYEMMVMEVRW